MQCRPLVVKATMLWHNLSLIGLQRWARKTKLAGARMCVCPSIIGIGARAAGLIGTEEALFDAPERRNDYGGNLRVTSGMWYVTRAILQTLAKNT